MSTGFAMVLIGLVVVFGCLPISLHLVSRWAAGRRDPVEWYMRGFSDGANRRILSSYRGVHWRWYAEGYGHGYAQRTFAFNDALKRAAAKEQP